MNDSKDITAVLLVGGMGTRLRSVVSGSPKPLAAIGGRSFLELLVNQLRYQGIYHLVMCSGYLADQIEEAFGDGRKWNIDIDYSRENEPLGTAGALKLAQHYLRNERDFLLMNGDSFLESNFGELASFHRGHNGLATMAVVSVPETARYGTVRVNPEGRVVAFAEKNGPGGPGLINAGVYMFNHAIFDCIGDGPCSLEKDIFPRVMDRGIYAIEQHGLFIDIGIPEDYARAQDLCDRLATAALGKVSTCPSS